ncbi:glycosyltransferase [uncultured Acinetobacter sp.]|uniref:glycosyltransferase n=1 Tax=uncultured Acinetobacter sp. TaxID=165433 RepID=UPI0026006FB6|nr:glycosyltransferase [uncultured Acinetobacter sp.]
MSKSLAIVLVTFNRVELLREMLDSIQQQTILPSKVIIINNASSDGTFDYLNNLNDDMYHIIHNDINSGGAGGFHQGTKLAYDLGYDAIFLVDDDILLDSKCIESLLKYNFNAMIAVREDKKGNIMETAGYNYNLSNPFQINPKSQTIAKKYHKRSEMPEYEEVKTISFEGFFIKREVIDKIGFPYEDYFIFFDDLDYGLRVLEIGEKIFAIRDAKIVRQFEYVQNMALGTWKSHYMYRNFFLIHYIYGKNVFVKLKPFIVYLGGVTLNFWKLNNIKTFTIALNDSLKLYKKILPLRKIDK